MQLIGGTPVAERYLWACAAHVHRLHGDRAHDEIQRRIYAMKAAGDAAGEATWINIARCLTAMTESDPDEARN
jgi:hypothetical protein